MPRFTVRDLLIATTLVAVGVGGLLVPYHYGEAILHAGAINVISQILFFGAGPLIGAGLFMPFRRPGMGACIGFVLQWLVLIISLPVVH